MHASASPLIPTCCASWASFVYSRRVYSITHLAQMTVKKKHSKGSKPPSRAPSGSSTLLPTPADPVREALTSVGEHARWLGETLENETWAATHAGSSTGQGAQQRAWLRTLTAKRDGAQTIEDAVRACLALRTGTYCFLTLTQSDLTRQEEGSVILMESPWRAVPLCAMRCMRSQRPRRRLCLGFLRKRPGELQRPVRSLQGCTSLMASSG